MFLLGWVPLTVVKLLFLQLHAWVRISMVE
jgi:hypothetical protein